MCWTFLKHPRNAAADSPGMPHKSEFGPSPATKSGSSAAPARNTLGAAKRALRKPGLVPGVIGGLVALVAVNSCYQTFSVLLSPGQVEHRLPDFVLLAIIDVAIGAASGASGYHLGQDSVRLLGLRGALASAAPHAGALIMAAAIVIIVDLVLLAFAFI